MHIKTKWVLSSPEFEHFDYVSNGSVSALIMNNDVSLWNVRCFHHLCTWLQFFFFFCSSFQTSQLQAWLDSITRGRKHAVKQVWWTAMRANRRETERRGQLWHEDINRIFSLLSPFVFSLVLKVLIKDELCCHGMLAWSIFRICCHCWKGNVIFKTFNLFFFHVVMEKKIVASLQGMLN